MIPAPTAELLHVTIALKKLENTKHGHDLINKIMKSKIDEKTAMNNPRAPDLLNI